MKLLISDISKILDEKLTLTQRGILITILLLKDPDSKITLAKLKVKVKMSKIKEDLITLHQDGYIEWSGYKGAIRRATQRSTPEIREVIIFFNKVCKRGFDFNSESTIKNLRNRLEDHSVEDIKKVISNRYLIWRNDPVMKKHLNPTTIFRPSKFDKYLEEALRTHEGSSIVEAEKIDLKHEDEITYQISQSLVDTEVYEVKEYKINSKGNRIGNGVVQKLYGSALKMKLRIQNNKKKRGDLIEFVYLYQKL